MGKEQVSWLIQNDMRDRFRNPLLSIAICLSLGLGGHFHATAQTAAYPQKDPAATQLIDSIFANNAWKPEDHSTQIVAVGHAVNQSSTSDKEAHHVTITVAGAQQYRYDDADKDFHVVKNSEGAACLQAQESHALTPQQASAIQPWPFPFLTVIGLYRRPEVGIRFTPGTSAGTLQTASIEIDAPSSGSVFTGFGHASRNDRYVAIIQAGQFISLRTVAPSSPVQQSTPDTTWQWSDYRDVNGLAIPFQADTLRGSDDIISLQIDTVQTSSNIPSSLFAVSR